MQREKNKIKEYFLKGWDLSWRGLLVAAIAAVFFFIYDIKKEQIGLGDINWFVLTIFSLLLWVVFPIVLGKYYYPK